VAKFLVFLVFFSRLFRNISKLLFWWLPGKCWFDTYAVWVGNWQALSLGAMEVRHWPKQFAEAFVIFSNQVKKEKV
jgi:hypothetical protein